MNKNFNSHHLFYMVNRNKRESQSKNDDFKIHVENKYQQISQSNSNLFFSGIYVSFKTIF